MSFTFPVLSDDEIQSMNLVPEGQYNFEVVKATDKVSKQGNAMLELQLKIWDSSGKERIVFDYLVGIPAMVYKIKNFCQTTGLTEKYNMGSFSAHDCLNKRGTAYIVVQKGSMKIDGGFYPDKNSVKDYGTANVPLSKQDLSVNPSTQKLDSPEFDDHIPF
jgi:hypothetical protein